MHCNPSVCGVREVLAAGMSVLNDKSIITHDNKGTQKLYNRRETVGVDTKFQCALKHDLRSCLYKESGT